MPCQHREVRKPGRGVVVAGLAVMVAALATLLPVAAWLGVFGGHLVPPAGSPYDLIAVQHNVSDENADPAATVRELLKVRPGPIALEEVTPAALPTSPICRRCGSGPAASARPGCRSPGSTRSWAGR
jgi:hypothetical protein